MARIPLQDMVRVKNYQKEKEKIFEKPKIEREVVPDYTDEYISKNNKNSKYRIYFVALISIVFLLFALSFLFSGAKVSVVPKIKEIPLNLNLTATKESNTNNLSFDLVVLSGEETKKIEGAIEEDVEKRAEGYVVIYNDYSSSPQVLDIDTRLEGSNGKIYKTKNKLTVPGVTPGGKPGSIEVGIYASSPGEEYNSVPLDFKIFGFKGTPKYTKFYARSKGDISGGFIGKSPVISSLDKVSITNELKASLESKLLKKIAAPSGFVLFKDAVFLDIKDRDITLITNEDKSTSMSVKGTLYGFLFDEKKLSKKISENSIKNGEEIYISNIKDLVFSLTNKEEISFQDTKNISFTLSGTPKIIWKVDEEKFISSLLGREKSDFDKILSEHSSIESAELVMRPFWKSSFPEESKNIKITVSYPE